jgi:chromosome segregation ATPase
VPEGAEALLLLTVEELAVNELREPFHHWVRTLRYPIQRGELGEALPHLAASLDAIEPQVVDRVAADRASDLWDEIKPDVQAVLRQLIESLTSQIQSELATRQTVALQEESDRFKHRLKEVERAMKETTLQKLEKERDKLLEDMQQLSLIPDERRSQEDRLRDLDDEMRRRRGHYQDLAEQLKKEQTRVLTQILPKRYTLRGVAQVFPVTVEIRLPGDT